MALQRTGRGYRGGAGPRGRDLSGSPPRSAPRVRTSRVSLDGGAASCGLGCRWAPRPSAQASPPVTARREPRGVAAEVSTSPQAKHGSHPLQRLARGHPRLLPAPPGLRVQQQLLRKCRVPWGGRPPPPGSPQGRPGSLVGQLLLREVHSSIHGHGVGVSRALGTHPGLHQRGHQWPGSRNHEAAASQPAKPSQHGASVLT